MNREIDRVYEEVHRVKKKRKNIVVKQERAHGECLGTRSR